MLEATLYFDGGIREGLMAYGYLLVDPENEDVILKSGNRTCGVGTSNIAEYRALIAGIKGSIQHGVDIIHIVGDSQLVVKQVLGVFKVKKPELKSHCDYVLELLEHFEDYTIKWVPRNQNKRADALVNQVFERRGGKCSKQTRKQRNKETQRRLSS
jgi:ribonuclease HI